MLATLVEVARFHTHHSRGLKAEVAYLFHKHFAASAHAAT